MGEIQKKRFRIIGENIVGADVISRPSINFWQDAWRRLKLNKVAMISLFFLVFIGIMCVIGPYLLPYKFNEQNLDIASRPPFGNHWFGTDDLGRDMFVRLWYGGRVSLIIGIVGTIIEILIGCIYGGISGYYGGAVDNIMMRIVEIIVGIPYMIVVVLISIVMGKGIIPMVIALVITAWTGIARLIRGQAMQLKESEYVLAAKALGAKPWRIVTKHLIPNTLGIIIIHISFDIPGYIFAESFLSFLGLGIQPPNTSWGAMAAYGMSVMDLYPHELLFPCLAISLTMLAFNLLGDGLRDAFDPKMRQ